ncbi:NOP2-LIKE NUCLEOLAR PROTEIN [Biomphalaria pfeifferi]|uniref:NOP2-LIKE NUCLEOLAR PROTEIN n=1 Tax=Biomphalaria pfeifferi TaxID=112525 RepID=A0AAD8AMY7_BIOPF|nr:NOP2-LIKE NUCLEOLAR PROTEIN [Biomphalaria pfeifferi]
MKNPSRSSFDRKCVEKIQQILENKSTVKKEVYKERNPKLYHRLVQMVVENHDLLLRTIRKCKFMENDPEMGVVKCFQILEKRLKNARLRRKFVEAMGEEKLKHTRNPLFVRINTLRGGKIEDLDGLDCEETPIEHVYRVSCVSSINDLKVYRDGKIVIQNIASCLPALHTILNPEEHSRVIDTCSAPGNKTSHLSMIMNNTGKIHAFEMDPNRVETLRTQLNKLGVTNTEVVHDDFIASAPEEFEAVRYVLCDPSCSGSGIHLNYKPDQDRIDHLKAFQIKIVEHALKFRPEKLIYSVCSEHREECEEVVEEVLRNPEYDLEDISGFWKSDESLGFPFSHKVIRCRSNSESGSIGFFIALFESVERQRVADGISRPHHEQEVEPHECRYLFCRNQAVLCSFYLESRDRLHSWIDKIAQTCCCGCERKECVREHEEHIVVDRLQKLLEPGREHRHVYNRKIRVDVVFSSQVSADVYEID